MTQDTLDAGRFDFVTSLIDADKAENGAFCQFLDPNGELLYLPGAKLPDGAMDASKAVGAYVRSSNSNAYDEHTERMTRQALERNKRAKTDADKTNLALRNQKRTTPEIFAGLVTRFLNTSASAPGEWEPTYEQKLAFALNPHLKPNVDRVLAFAGEPSNYPAQGNVDAV